MFSPQCEEVTKEFISINSFCVNVSRATVWKNKIFVYRKPNLKCPFYIFRQFITYRGRLKILPRNLLLVLEGLVEDQHSGESQYRNF